MIKTILELVSNTVILEVFERNDQRTRSNTTSRSNSHLLPYTSNLGTPFQDIYYTNSSSHPSRSRSNCNSTDILYLMVVVYSCKHSSVDFQVIFYEREKLLKFSRFALEHPVPSGSQSLHPSPFPHLSYSSCSQCHLPQYLPL